VVEPNGIGLEDFACLPERGGLRRSLAVAGAPLIVFLGRVHPGKGVEYLIPALARVRTPGATLAVVGSDSAGYRGEMERLADAHGVRDRVVFVGPLSGRKKIEALVDADVFCLPSQHENFGISIVEAMAAGCAVVVSEHVGIKEEILAAGAGSVTSLDPARIAAALDDWLGDEGGRREAGTRGREFALHTYDWAPIAARWQRRYEELMAVSSRPHSGPTRGGRGS
jgi:glycosyltransferase involved in cell wall biosynthesis